MKNHNKFSVLLNISLYYKIIFLLLLQSCVPNLPQYKKNPQENLNIPSSFENAANQSKLQPESQNENEKNNQKNLVAKNWKLFFEDKYLKNLIEIALQNNQDLNILEQEVNIAQNQVISSQSQYFPQVGIGAGIESEKTSEFTRNGAIEDATGLKDHLNNRKVSLNASWEVDIFKKLRNAAKSAYYQYLASVEGKHFLQTQIISEVANKYYELLALDNQLETLNQYVATLKEAQNVAEAIKFAGRTNSLAVRRFDAEVAKSESRKAKILQQIVETQNSLNRILGRLPQDIERNSKIFKELSLQKVTTNIPAALLENRPDVKQSSLLIEAAKLNLKSVKAQFYPSLNIDANVGYQSFNAKHFIGSPSSLAYGVAGSITAPLLNRNAIKAEYFSANNKQIEAIYNYEKTFIAAFGEVVNQLAAVENLKEAYAQKNIQVEKLSESFEISNILFKAARVDYLESLLTRRDYLEAQMELFEVKHQQLAAYVNLYRALGGGWRESD